MLFPLVLLLLAAPGKTPEELRLAEAQKLFNQGEFDGALKVLDQAVALGGSPKVVSKQHLLRGQLFAAQQDFSRAEGAFKQALEADVSAALDPARVDPTVVRLLESVRSRMTGTLVVDSTPGGAAVFIDGAEAGRTPLSRAVPAGEHTVAVQWEGASQQSTRVVIRARQESRVQWVQAAGAGPGFLTERPVRPFGDVRGAFEPYVSGRLDGGLELGGGAELSWFRLGVWFRLYPAFWVTPRFQFALPVHENFSVVLEAAVPFAAYPYFNVGLAGAGGAEWYPFKFIGAYVMFGGRYFFVGENHPDNRTSFLLNAGVRLRVP